MSFGLMSHKRRKQRKALFTANGEERRIRMSSHLSKELRSVWGFRSFPVRSNDLVMITTGKFQKKVGRVVEVDRKSMKVYVEGCNVNKANGNPAPYPIDPSNLEIKEFHVDDNRKVALDRKKDIYEKTKTKYATMEVQ